MFPSFSAPSPQGQSPSSVPNLMVAIGGCQGESLGGQPCDRWPIYFRLQELGIPCRCHSHGPLEAAIATPLQALQVWSVVHRHCTPRPALATWLEGCWALPSPRS